MKLHAQWITGFVDGEGCFIVGVCIHPDCQIADQLQPEFSVAQHSKDIQVLYALKDHFGCGSIQLPKGDKVVAQWRVRKLSHLIKYVIPFFEKHKLKTKRGIEFQRFRRLCLMLDQKVHLSSKEGFEECLQLARNLRIKLSPNIEIDKGRVQLLPELTESVQRLCKFTDLKERRLTERNSLAPN